MCRSIFFKHDSLAVSSLSWFPCYNLTMVKKWLKKLTNLFSTWMFVSGSCYFLHEIALRIFYTISWQWANHEGGIMASELYLKTWIDLHTPQWHSFGCNNCLPPKSEIGDILIVISSVKLTCVTSISVFHMFKTFFAFWPRENWVREKEYSPSSPHFSNDQKVKNFKWRKALRKGLLRRLQQSYFNLQLDC